MRLQVAAEGGDRPRTPHRCSRRNDPAWRVWRPRVWATTRDGREEAGTDHRVGGAEQTLAGAVQDTTTPVAGRPLPEPGLPREKHAPTPVPSLETEPWVLTGTALAPADTGAGATAPLK